MTATWWPLTDPRCLVCNGQVSWKHGVPVEERDGPTDRNLFAGFVHDSCKPQWEAR